MLKSLVSHIIISNNSDIGTMCLVQVTWPIVVRLPTLATCMYV